MLYTELLSKIYRGDGLDTIALDAVDIKIDKGEFIAIMGPSGSGKSTLLNLIGALDSPTSGKIFLDGIETTALNSAGLALLRNKKIGFIFQSFNLISRFTALVNVELPLSILGISVKARKKRAYEMLKLVGLDDRWNHTPNQLSGGQQQRVAIARALSVDPPIILGDEPTGNLDSTTSGIIINLLSELNQKTGKTIILITHDPDVAMKASRVITVKDGKIEDDNYDIKTKKTI
ncbi:MAG: macrolide ABC transporter ATP-binding protein [Thaumarchaeota archaeon]|nr:macrolide ABC transporter ATP-binding protein [Nitrososphaerota archaeon]